MIGEGFQTSLPSDEFSKLSNDPFLTWKEAVHFHENFELNQSMSRFKEAAQQFFKLASDEERVARAYYEYSTLMDAFSRIQLARLNIRMNEFDSALTKLDEVCNILRSTIHFGFLAPFVSACATTETANMMDNCDPECIQAYKNAIALLEQSKLALSFRDDQHFLLSVIEADIRFFISKALFVESLDQKRQGNIESSREKVHRSGLLEKEFEALLRKADTKKQNAFYFPLDDYRRVMASSFVVSFPGSSDLWLLNVGRNSAQIEKIGNSDSVNLTLDPKESISFSQKEIGKGKIRVTYSDLSTGKKYEEGCVTAI